MHIDRTYLKNNIYINKKNDFYDNQTGDFILSLLSSDNEIEFTLANYNNSSKENLASFI